MQRHIVNPWPCDGLLASWNVILERLDQGQCKPASSVLGVTRLAFDLMIEIEATAVEYNPSRKSWRERIVRTPTPASKGKP